MTRIVNIKSGAKYDIYCGRKHKWNNLPESIFHNPFVIGKDGQREEVIEKFKKYAPTNKQLMDSLYLIDDKILGCWCDYPKENCHCSVLIELREKQKSELLKVDRKIPSPLIKKTYKLAVIGSRGITQYPSIYEFLDSRIDKIELIVSGGCKNSPDEIAHQWCKNRGVPILIYYPDWGGKGRRAGFDRNRKIIESADNVVAFYDGQSKGTANSISIAEELGKPCKVIILKPNTLEDDIAKHKERTKNANFGQY